MDYRRTLDIAVTWTIAILFHGIIGFPLAVIVTFTCGFFVAMLFALLSLDLLGAFIVSANWFVTPLTIGWVLGCIQQRTLLKGYTWVSYWWPCISALLMFVFFQLLSIWSEKYMQFGF